ncbi:MAG: glycosyltransferase [Streptosporangiaceae bacterium]|nr:glycosyltransferase [Streptosporangiaceae bacterium]MBV9855904.1 glycosyltransferase [Streptosporangiaceae bacterium]
MKIALIAQNATPLHGSAAGADDDNVRLSKLARGLAGQGHEVTVYARKDRCELPDNAELEPGVRVEHLGPAAGPGDTDLLKRMPAFTGRLQERLRRERPDVVHALRWTSGLAALAATRGLGVPVVQTFYSLGVAERRHRVIPEAAGIERIRLEPAIGRSATAVLAASSDEESDLTRLGVPRKSIKVVPCGIDTDEFAPEGPVASRNGRPRLITVTELSNTKPIDTLLRALTRVPSAELVVAGGPPRTELSRDKEYPGLARLAAALGVSDRVMFAGHVGRHELPALMRSADLLVSTPEYEPTGTVSLEAMACGTPVVASAVGGQVDAVVDGTTGILVPPGRPALLASKIRQLLAHPMLLEAYSVAAADRARSRYSWDRIARETAAVYDSARGAMAA